MEQLATKKRLVGPNHPSSELDKEVQTTLNRLIRKEPSTYDGVPIEIKYLPKHFQLILTLH